MSLDLSVVIASVLHLDLIDTVLSIRSSSYPVKEIIVVYPIALKDRIVMFERIYDLVTFVPSDIASQVSQRFLGFQRSTTELVLQSDDDIIYDFDSISRLVASFISLNNTQIAIAPCFFDSSSRLPIHQVHPIVRFIYKYFLGVSPLYGSITPFSTSYGVDPLSCKSSIFDLFPSQWLPGGCVLHHQANLVYARKEFPFSGKAYCEDLIDSFYRSVHGIRHFVCLSSRVFIEPVVIPLTFSDICSDFKARLYFVRLSSRMLVFFLLWSLLSYSRRLVYYSFTVCRSYAKTLF